MIEPFTYDALPGRVVFGAGSRRSIAAEVDRLGATRCLLIASGRDEALVSSLSGHLGPRAVARFSDVAQHVPVAKANVAVGIADAEQIDTVIAIGGGSAIGFGKAVALARDVASVAIPTTYSGSEMTTIWGRSADGHKETGNDARVKPDTVIYDADLTVGLPASIAGPSGMNAMAHAVEALYGAGANPVIDAIAIEAARALAAGLPRLTSSDADANARTDVLYGAYLAGVALATGGTALHHKTCHVLGGMFGLDHGQMNAVVLSHAAAYNAPAIGPQLDRLAHAFAAAGRPVASGAEVPGALFDLAADIGCPTSLAEIGMPADRISEAARRVVVDAAANVIAPTEDAVTTMLTAAHKGERPT
ncbi:MAG: maleylacetate reductase [Actinomycetota bacterium]